MKMSVFTLSIALAIMAVSARAQAPAATTSTSASTSTSTDSGSTIHHRKLDQQDRIAQGLKSGQLTASEASALEKQEAGINKEESGMREQDNGKLTSQDKKTLNSQLNVESKDIYEDKHNGSTQPAAKGEINDRLQNQQDRISAGVKSDTLTNTQVAHLENQEAGIGKEESGMRAQDDGKLTTQDKKTLNHQLNQESRRIRRDEYRTTHHK